MTLFPSFLSRHFLFQSLLLCKKGLAVLIFLSIWVSQACVAETKTFITTEKYQIFFTAFNSSNIQPAIAREYGLTRGKDIGLVNVAVVEKGNIKGKPAQVSGTVNNMLAQMQTLIFKEIDEGDATYYIAPYRFDHLDRMTFLLKVKPAPDAPIEEIKFQRQLYLDGK